MLCLCSNALPGPTVQWLLVIDLHTLNNEQTTLQSCTEQEYQDITAAPNLCILELVVQYG